MSIISYIRHQILEKIIFDRTLKILASKGFKNFWENFGDESEMVTPPGIEPGLQD